MLDYINLRNFKSLKDIDLPLAKINLIIGVNRTGKSSVFQSIAVLKQSKGQQGLLWSGTAIALGDFEDVLTRGAGEDEIVIQFGGSLKLSKNVANLLSTPQVNYGLHIATRKVGFQTIGYKITFGSKELTGMISRNLPPKTPSFGLAGFQFNIREDFNSVQPLQVAGSMHPQNATAEEVDVGYKAIQELINVFTRQVDLCSLVPTTRGFDQLFYQLLDGYVENIPGTEGLARLAGTIASNLAYRKKYSEEIANLVKKVLPDVKDIGHSLATGRKVRLESRDAFGEYALQNEGFGLNQLIPLFYHVISTPPGASLFIEEPEIALHPAAQSALITTLIEEAYKGDKQLVITTHSEHVLLGVLENIMAGKLKANELKIYYFEKEGGITKATPLKVNDKGEIEGGLKGFFEADMEHLNKFLTSLEARKEE